MNDKRTLRDDLIAAKTLIDTPERWHKGSHHNGDWTCHCAMGAVLIVTNAESPYSPRVEACREALQVALPSRITQPVGLYNDRASTTHGDIIMALFDRAIAAAEVQS